MEKLVQEQLNKVINLVMDLHSNKALNEKKTVRGHDNITPYYTHPIGCACMVLEDNNSNILNFDKRFELAVSLLCHDLLEDTTITEKTLKNELLNIFNNEVFVNKIIKNVKACTIGEKMSSMDEFKKLKEHPEKYSDEVWYIKTVDKWYNLFGSKNYFIKKGTLSKYIEFLNFLIEQLAKSKFKDSMFIIEAKSLSDFLSKNTKNTPTE